MREGPATREDYEALLATLIGRTIRRVCYFELDEGEKRPNWNRESGWYDTLDFGLTLTLDSDKELSFIWGAEFIEYEYNVSVVDGPLALDRPAVWDVTERWKELAGEIVSATRVYWQRCHTKDGDSEYPEDVRIDFTNGRSVFVSSFEMMEDGKPFRGMDTITVFFDETAWRKVTGGQD